MSDYNIIALPFGCRAIAFALFKNCASQKTFFFEREFLKCNCLSLVAASTNPQRTSEYIALHAQTSRLLHDNPGKGTIRVEYSFQLTLSRTILSIG